MRLTTRIALAAVAFCASINVAEAKPRHVVVLTFDGPRTLAETGRTAVILALADYDLVATPRWQEAQARAHEDANAQGSAVWSKAAKTAGVDAVVDGWVQDKQLTVIVHDANDGSATDQLTVKLGAQGLSNEAAKQLRLGLEERLAAIGPGLDVKPKYAPVPRETTAGQKPDRSENVNQAVTTTAPTTTTTTATAAAAPAPGSEISTPERKASAAPDTVATVEQRPPCLDVFGDCVQRDPRLPPQPQPVPVATPRFRFDIGAGLQTRTLHFQADAIENITQYDGVGNKALAVHLEAYPFPLARWDGQLSGPGVSLSLYHSVGSTVGIDDEESTGDYNINQNGFLAALHWRQPVGKIVHLDGEVGYSQDNYIIEDPPEGYEVPDTAYRSLHAGAHCDLTVARRATVGFGWRYFYVLDQGDLTSVAFYGPGSSSAWSLDTNFVVPLPHNIYVQGRLGYKRIKTTFDGVGDITEEEDVFDGTDSTVEGQAAVGIEF